MKEVRRWLLADSSKVPYYVSGVKRSGKLDSVEDLYQLASYEDAKAALEGRAGGWFLGFALGAGWQGIDFDDVSGNGLAALTNSVPGYVEMSPSGVGAHALGYGRPFNTLGPNGSGVEAYCGGRYFTVTERPIRDGGLVCLADYVEQALVPRHGAGRAASAGTSAVELIRIDAKTVTELRSALLSMRSDDYHLWVRMGFALRELGDAGRALWMEWSTTSSGKFDPKLAAKKWDGFEPDRTGYQAVFAEAARHGWVNPASGAAQLFSAAVVVSDFQQRVPRNFLSTAVAPPIHLANVPGPVAAFAHACSTAYGFDQSGLVMAALTAAAAMADDAYRLEVMPRWYVSARLWTVLIGKSATGKSPILKMATAPIKEKHNDLATEYELHCACLEHEDPRPPRPALYTSDATIEALSVRLKDNPRGMLMLTEEFFSWIGGIDSSSKGDAAKSRGNWLQLYDGGPYQIDRIMRGSNLIENWGASILTASTPSGLADQMKYLPEDGLIQRFIPVIVGPMNHGADGDAGAAQDQWKNWLFWIHEQTGRANVVQFSAEARKLFMATKAEVGRTASATDDISSGLASHVSKHTEMIARLALVFHLFDAGPPAVLSAETLQKAVNFMAQLRRHSVALFTDILGASPATDIARALARSLAAADPNEAQVIGRDWMTRHCRAFEKAKDERVRREAVQLLEDLDWIQVSGSGVYSGWPKRFEVNRNIFRLYAREGEIHRAKRAAVKAVFEDLAQH